MKPTKVFSVKADTDVVTAMQDSPEYNTYKHTFDRAYITIDITKRKTYHFSLTPSGCDDIAWHVKNSSYPQGPVLTKEQFLSLFLMPNQEARVAFIAAVAEENIRKFGNRIFVEDI